MKLCKPEDWILDKAIGKPVRGSKAKKHRPVSHFLPHIICGKNIRENVSKNCLTLHLWLLFNLKVLEHKMCEPQETSDYSIGPSRSISGGEMEIGNIFTEVSEHEKLANSTV